MLKLITKFILIITIIAAFVFAALGAFGYLMVTNHVDAPTENQEITQLFEEGDK